MNKNIQFISKQIDRKHLLNKAIIKSELYEPDIALCSVKEISTTDLFLSVKLC